MILVKACFLLSVAVFQLTKCLPIDKTAYSSDSSIDYWSSESDNQPTPTPPTSLQYYAEFVNQIPVQLSWVYITKWKFVNMSCADFLLELVAKKLLATYPELSSNFSNQSHSDSEHLEWSELFDAFEKAKELAFKKEQTQGSEKIAEYSLQYLGIRKKKSQHQPYIFPNQDLLMPTLTMALNAYFHYHWKVVQKSNFTLNDVSGIMELQHVLMNQEFYETKLRVMPSCQIIQECNLFIEAFGMEKPVKMTQLERVYWLEDVDLYLKEFFGAVGKCVENVYKSLDEFFNENSENVSWFDLVDLAVNLMSEYIVKTAEPYRAADLPFEMEGLVY